MDRMMSTPVEKPNSSSALQVPETLLNILNYLENDRGTLYNVLQVNRMWFECGVSVLWKMVKFKRLQGAGKENRPFYASKIHYLLFEGDVAHEDFKDLEFSNLRIISIDSYRPKDGNIYLTQYLRPTLERIQIYGTDLNEEFLSTMEKCRRVKEFLLDSPGDRVTAERFLSFLQNCPSLDNLQFKYGMEKVINDDTVVYLAGKDNLRSLGLGPELTVKALDRALETVPTPFKHVESLDIKLSSAALRLLLPHLSQVQDLELTIKDNDRSVLVQLSALKALRSLAVSYACIADLTSSEILSLNQLKNLETLTLTGSDEDMEPNHLDCFQFTDDDLDTLLSQLPRLKTLQFGLQTMMTSNALQIVAKYCPLLNTLQLFVPIKLSTILPESPDAKPMLPKLISLDIADFECPNDVSIKDKEAFKNAAKICAEHIIRQFPKLTILGVMTDDPFAMLVTEVINRLIGHKFERSCSDALLERSRSDALLASLGIYDLLDQFEIDGFLDEDSFEGDDHEFDYDPQPENMERRLEMEERLLLDADDSAGDMMELGLELDHDDDDENPAG